MRSVVAALVASFAFVATAHADIGPIPGEEQFQGLTDQTNHAGAALGIGQIGEDTFLTITPQLDLNLGPVGLGLEVPLNLRIIDKPPKAKHDIGGIIRKEDWDQVSDYLKVIRYIRYGQKGDTFYFRVGELAARLGHGTIMDRYLNNVDPNTFHLGLQLDINTDFGGIESVFSDLPFQGNGSKIVGVRLYLKPVGFVAPQSLFNVFRLGFTIVDDTTAPFKLGSGAKDGTFKVADARPFTEYGVDLDADVLSNPLIDLTPYMDMNFIDKAGWGFHAGVLLTLKLPVGFDLQLPIRVEYRRFRQDYLPTYFDTFYELERFQYPLSSSGKASKKSEPKSFYIRKQPGDKGINGYYADAAFNFAGVLQIGAVYEDYDGGDPNLSVFVNVPAFDVFQLKAYYARTGIKGVGDIFALDDRSMAVAQARYKLVKFVYLVARWTRTWVVDTSKSQLAYKSTDDWNVGIETSFNF